MLKRLFGRSNRQADLGPELGAQRAELRRLLLDERAVTSQEGLEASRELVGVILEEQKEAMDGLEKRIAERLQHINIHLREPKTLKKSIFDEIIAENRQVVRGYQEELAAIDEALLIPEFDAKMASLVAPIDEIMGDIRKFITNVDPPSFLTKMSKDDWVELIKEAKGIIDEAKDPTGFMEGMNEAEKEEYINERYKFIMDVGAYYIKEELKKNVSGMFLERRKILMGEILDRRRKLEGRINELNASIDRLVTDVAINRLDQLLQGLEGLCEYIRTYESVFLDSALKTIALSRYGEMTEEEKQGQIRQIEELMTAIREVQKAMSGEEIAEAVSDFEARAKELGLKLPPDDVSMSRVEQPQAPQPISPPPAGGGNQPKT